MRLRHILQLFPIIFLASQVCTTSDKQFSKYQQMFKSSPINTQLPTPVEVSVDDEQKQYIANYQQRINSPHHSYHVKLTGRRTEDSIFLSGYNLQKFHFEVIVNPQTNKQSQLTQESKPLALYVLEQNSRKVIESFAIHRHKVITVQNLQEKLYEILIKLQEQQNKDYANKTVIIETAIQYKAKKQNKQINNWLKQYWTKTNNLYDQSTMIFLDSLETWDIIQSSSEKYNNHEYNWMAYSFIQLVALMVMLIAQLAYIKKLLHSDVVLI